MTIKVHKKGTTTFRVGCTNCGCEFSYDMSDVSTIVLWTPCVTCPTCKQRILHVGKGRREE